MVNICETCGDRGFPEALVHCDKCKVTATHLYCLPVLPKSFKEEVIWYCEDCEPKIIKQATYDHWRSLSVSKFDSRNLEFDQATQFGSRLKKNAGRRLKKKKRKKRDVSGSLAKAEALYCENSSLLHEKDQEFKRPRKSNGSIFYEEFESPKTASGDGECNTEYGCELQCSESDKSNHKLGREIELDGNSSDEDIELYEDAELFKTRTSRLVTNDPSNTLECSSNAHNNDNKFLRQRELVRNNSDADAESVKTSSVAKGDPLSILRSRSDICAKSIIEVQCNENEEKDQTLVIWRGSDGDCSNEEAESVKLATTLIASSDPSNIPKHNCYISAQPIIEPIWKGSLHLSNYKYGTVGGLVAHLSSLACSKVFEEAKLLPELLSPTLLPRSDVWPKSFHKWGPSDDNIALYLFPKSESDEKVYYTIVDDMISQDLAMRVVVKNAELLLFTSNILPFQFWRFQSKFYFWGVFRGKQSTSSRALALYSANEITLVESKGPPHALTWHTHSPVSPWSNSGSYGSGSVYSCHSGF